MLNNIRTLEKVISILSEPLGIALFIHSILTYLPENKNVLLPF